MSGSCGTGGTGQRLTPAGNPWNSMRQRLGKDPQPTSRTHPCTDQADPHQWRRVPSWKFRLSQSWIQLELCVRSQTRAPATGQLVSADYCGVLINVLTYCPCVTLRDGHGISPRAAASQKLVTVTAPSASAVFVFVSALWCSSLASLFDVPGALD